MALNASILADGLLDMQANPPDDEAAAINVLAGVLSDYFKTAEAGTVPINGLAVDGQLGTIQAGLAGLNTAGAVAIQTSCIAFWTAVIAAPTGFFTGCSTPALISVSLVGIAAAVLIAAADNIANSHSPVVSTQAVADAIDIGHTTTPSTVTLLSGPTVVPIL